MFAILRSPGLLIAHFLGLILKPLAKAIVTAVFILGPVCGVILAVQLFPEIVFVTVSMLFSPLGLIAFFMLRS